MAGRDEMGSQIDSDLDAQIKASMQEFDEGETEEHAVEEQAPADTVDAAPEPSEESAPERQRGPDGKFVSTKEPSGEDEPPATEAIDPAPQSWGVAAKAKWAELPMEVRKELTKREADIAQGFSKHSERAKAYDAVAAALEPIRQGLTLNGVTEAQFIQRAVAVDQYLRQDPGAAIKWLAQTYGYQLGSLLPTEAAPDNQVSGLTNRLNTIEQRFAADRARVEQEERRRAESTVNAFMADPKHKYASDVVEEMSAFLAVDPDKNLETAYQKAIWANEKVRQAIRAEETAKKTTAAKRTASVNIRSNGAGQQPAIEGDLDSQIRASIRESMERAGR